MAKTQRHGGTAHGGDGEGEAVQPGTPEEIEGMLLCWRRERSLPSSDPDELASVLVAALADHWSATPEPLRDAVLAVAAVLRASL